MKLFDCAGAWRPPGAWMLSQSMLVMPGAQMDEQPRLGQRMLHCNARGSDVAPCCWQSVSGRCRSSLTTEHQDLAETQRELNILSNYQLLAAGLKARTLQQLEWNYLILSRSSLRSARSRLLAFLVSDMEIYKVTTPQRAPFRLLSSTCLEGLLFASWFLTA